jgi:L-iditol 2-dehydrogenase
MALHMGANVVLDPNEWDVCRQIVADTGGRGVDCAIDCAAKEHTHNWAFRVLRNGGRMVLTGIHSAAVVGFEVSHMRRKEIAIFNVRRSNTEAHDALHFLTEKASLFAPMVTHRRPLSDIGSAFALVEHYEDGVGKLVVV